jgi:hypothetical protein
VEVEQATLFGQQESEILLRRDLGNLTQRLCFPAPSALESRN